MPNQSNTNKQPVSLPKEFRLTGEVRPPKKGDWYMSGDTILEATVSTGQSAAWCYWHPILTPIYDKEPESEDELTGAHTFACIRRADSGGSGCTCPALHTPSPAIDELAEAVRGPLKDLGRGGHVGPTSHYHIELLNALKAYDKSRESPQPDQPKQESLSEVVEKLLEEDKIPKSQSVQEGVAYSFRKILKAALARQKLHDEAVAELVEISKDIAEDYRFIDGKYPCIFGALFEAIEKVEQHF